jgi:hypothetical protein
VNEQEYFGDIDGAYEEEQAERLKECAALIAEKAGVSLEEAAALLEVEPRAQRRKKARSRARFIEQRYRAEIRRAEGERIYRRIYKPP